MSKLSVHVIPNESGWAVRKARSERASSLHPTQEEAIHEARRQAIKEQTKLFIHRPNGAIRDMRSYEDATLLVDG